MESRCPFLSAGMLTSETHPPARGTNLHSRVGTVTHRCGIRIRYNIATGCICGLANWQSALRIVTTTIVYSSEQFTGGIIVLLGTFAI